jgi:hypothetical protein
MTNNAKIKVIKKGDIKPRSAVVESKKPSKKESARDMVSTVTTWVSDFQHRKRNETRTAIENLFVQQPATSQP